MGEMRTLTAASTDAASAAVHRRAPITAAVTPEEFLAMRTSARRRAPAARRDPGSDYAGGGGVTLQSGVWPHRSGPSRDVSCAKRDGHQSRGDKHDYQLCDNINVDFGDDDFDFDFDFDNDNIDVGADVWRSGDRRDVRPHL